MDKQTTVTVSVLTYNSSKYVLDTLESIKAQTYPNLILHICDDCSTDSTIDICRKWIERNKERFVSTDIIVPGCNTGVSANANRAWDACTTRYNKDIAGDDILLPNCIEDNIEYIKENPDALMVFSKIVSFGTSKKVCQEYDKRVWYGFYNETPEYQNELLHEANRMIAPTAFYNIPKLRALGIRHDERIPMMEDYPKWIQASDKGVKFHFFDKVTVKYRISEGSISQSSVPSRRYIESIRLASLYYNVNYNQNLESVVADILMSEKDLISEYLELKKNYVQIKQSKAYRFGHFVMVPLTKLKEIAYSLKK